MGRARLRAGLPRRGLVRRARSEHGALRVRRRRRPAQGLGRFRSPKPALALRHGAGVTAVLCDDDAVATGSYDESVRLWDLRAPAAPTASFAVGGGAHALARDGDGYLAACMGAGARVLRAAPLSVAASTTTAACRPRRGRHGPPRRSAPCSFMIGGARWRCVGCFVTAGSRKSQILRNHRDSQVPRAWTPMEREGGAARVLRQGRDRNRSQGHGPMSLPQLRRKP